MVKKRTKMPHTQKRVPLKDLKKSLNMATHVKRWQKKGFNLKMKSAFSLKNDPFSPFFCSLKIFIARLFDFFKKKVIHHINSLVSLNL